MVPPKTEADETRARDAEEGTPEELQPPATSSGSGAFIAAAVVATVFALLAVVMALVAVHFKSKADSANVEDRTTVATIAAQLAEAITAIDAAGDNKAEADVVHRLGTGPVIEQYDTIIPATRQVFVAAKAKSERGQITPGGVYVGDVGSGQAQVIVVVDLVIIGEITRVVPNQYLRMHLVKLNGEWKVDNINDVNTALAAQAGGSASTTSTLPTTSASSSSG